MGFFVIFRAISVRVLFGCHGLIAIWRLHTTTEKPQFWMICGALLLLIMEGVITIYKKRGNEWKWSVARLFFTSNAK